MKRNYPKVSFVIPAHNEQDYIGDAIESIQKQKTVVSYEIIVVNNASADNTVSVSKKYGVEIVNEERKGLTFARQKGFEKSKGDFIIYMDADTRLPDNFIKIVSGYFEKHKDVVCTSYNYCYYDGRAIDNILLFIFQSILPVLNCILDIFNKPEIIIGLIMVIRINALKKAGGINEKFVFYGEDAEIARTLYTQGKVKNLNYPVVATSARRYKNRGTIKTLFLYWISFFLIYFGKVKWAEAISQTQKDF